MKARPACLLVAIVLLIPSITNAGSKPEKFSLGAGVYLMELYDEQVFSDREAQHGGILSVEYLIDSNFVIFGNYYALDQGDVNDTDIEGSEILLFYGRDLSRPGLQQIVGGGFFREDWENSAESKTVSGPQLGYGLRYKWDNTSLTGLLHYRFSRDYDDIENQLEEDLNSVFLLSVIYSIQL